MLTQSVEPAALLPIKLKSAVGTLARQLRALARTNRDVAPRFFVTRSELKIPVTNLLEQHCF